MGNPVLLCIVAVAALLALEMILNTIIRVVYIWKARQLSDLQKLDKEEHATSNSQ